MAQTAISTKYTMTAITGTAGTTWDVAGRDDKAVLQYRQAVTANIPNSDTIMTHKAAFAGNGETWKSSTVVRLPVMETLAAGGSSGYVAQPKVAANSYFNLSVTRSALDSQANVLRRFDEFLYALCIDAKLRASVLGYVIADA